MSVCDGCRRRGDERLPTVWWAAGTGIPSLPAAKGTPGRVLTRSRASDQRIEPISEIRVRLCLDLAREQGRSKAERFARKQDEVFRSGWERSGQIQYGPPFIGYAVEILDGSLRGNDAHLAANDESSEVACCVPGMALDPEYTDEYAARFQASAFQCHGRIRDVAPLCTGIKCVTAMGDAHYQQARDQRNRPADLQEHATANCRNSHSPSPLHTHSLSMFQSAVVNPGEVPSWTTPGSPGIGA
jgi:hypothetical protein